MDRVFRTAGEWALASDGHQWMLMRRTKRHGAEAWNPVSFVRSTRSILERCAREKGVDACTSLKLLEGLPDTFDEWEMHHTAPNGPRPPSKSP